MNALKFYASFTPLGCAILYALTQESSMEFMKIAVLGTFILGVFLCIAPDSVTTITLAVLILCCVYIILLEQIVEIYRYVYGWVLKWIQQAIIECFTIGA